MKSGRDRAREDPRSASASGWRAARRSRCGSRRSSTCRRVVDQFNLAKWVGQEEARDKLMQAGYRGQAPYVTFLFFRMVTPIVALIAALFYVFVVVDMQQPPMIKLGICDRRRLSRHAAAVALPEEQDYAPASSIDQARLPGCARPAADLRRVRHVDRGRLPQGEPGNRLAIGPARRRIDADDGRTVLSAGPPAGLREPRQAHRSRRRQVGLRRACSRRNATARRSARRCA